MGTAVKSVHAYNKLLATGSLKLLYTVPLKQCFWHQVTMSVMFCRLKGWPFACYRPFIGYDMFAHVYTKLAQCHARLLGHMHADVCQQPCAAVPMLMHARASATTPVTHHCIIT
jgi:hypothetical protein